MHNDELDEVRDFWNRVATDWQIQVGDLGDENRRLNSDPVLWRFVGEVKGRQILDAGCGTGYLSRMLRDRGAHVTGIDLSENMIAIARANAPDIEFHVDSASELKSVADSHYDVIVANYVLMDTPDLNGTMAAFNRVLKLDGVAVVVFSHPCFPQGRSSPSKGSAQVSYDWDDSYFEPTKRVDRPWAHFKSEFIWYHRPLSDYWKSFSAAGFHVTDFEEPRVAPDRYHLASTPNRLRDSQTRPYSVAFRLQKIREAIGGTE